MTFTREVTIWCDGEGCGVWEQASGRTVNRFRRSLKKRGWAQSGKNDYCPSCTLKRGAHEVEDPVPSETR